MADYICQEVFTEDTAERYNVKAHKYGWKRKVKAGEPCGEKYEYDSNDNLKHECMATELQYRMKPNGAPVNTFNQSKNWTIEKEESKYAPPMNTSAMTTEPQTQSESDSKESEEKSKSKKSSK